MHLRRFNTHSKPIASLRFEFEFLVFSVSKHDDYKLDEQEIQQCLKKQV